MNKKKYNTEDENLQLWGCHPEKICINCKYFSIKPEDEWRCFATICSHIDRPWVYSITGYKVSKTGFSSNLFTARECDDFELKAGIENEI